jgi:hypothetical protein
MFKKVLVKTYKAKVVVIFVRVKIDFYKCANKTFRPRSFHEFKLTKPIYFILLKAPMKNFVTYLSTAPVIAFAWISFTAGFIIEVNRFSQIH